jgi:hypothetical protein
MTDEKMADDPDYRARPIFRVISLILGILFLVFPVMAFWESGIKAFYKDGHNSMFYISALGFGLIFLIVAFRGKYYEKF